MSVNVNNTSVNIFNFNSNGVNPNVLDSLDKASFQGVDDILSNIFKDFSQLFDKVGSQFNGNQNIRAGDGGCVHPPQIEDGSQPQGSLKSDGNAITTAGGYKIEATDKFNWKITGPDGKVTEVQGDPHVIEGDGGKWDFKRNSSFILGDGTKVNVTTTPYGNGATVTQGLEIISGNERATISGIDKGKGVTSQITQDGYAHANDFGGNDVFVMGKESDDWSFQGKEVVGSNNGGDSFKLGNDLAAGSTQTNNTNSSSNDFLKLLHNFVNDLMGGWNQNLRPNNLGTSPYNTGLFNDKGSSTNTGVTNNNTNNTNNTNGLWSGNRNDIRYDRPHHQREMRQAFRLFGEMFRVMGQLAKLSDQMSSFRNRGTRYA